MDAPTQPFVADVPGLTCRFELVHHASEAIVTSATRYLVTLAMELDGLRELELELIETLSPARDPEAELADELRRASDPALAMRWVDTPVRAAWLAIQSDWGYGTASLLRIERGQVRLRAIVAAWDRKRMDKLLAVMTALSTARMRFPPPARLAPELIA